MKDKENYFTVKHNDDSTALKLNGNYEVVGFIPTTSTRVCVILLQKEDVESD